MILISLSSELDRPMFILLLLCTFLLSLTIPTVMPSESPSFHPSSNVPTIFSPSVDSTVMPSESPSFHPSSKVPTTISPSVDSTVMPSESPSFHPSSKVPTTISPSVSYPSYFPTLPDEYLLTINFTQVKCFSRYSINFVFFIFHCYFSVFLVYSWY